jgi:hypothetical protein
MTVSQPVSLGVDPHLGLMTRYLLLFDSYGFAFCGAPSLTRGRVCLLYMVLALASAVFLGSESLGTRDHILLSQIWDFPFVASYDLQGHTVEVFDPASTRGHHCSLGIPRYIASGRIPRKTPPLNYSYRCLPVRCLEMDVLLFHGTLL